MMYYDKYTINYDYCDRIERLFINRFDCSIAPPEKIVAIQEMQAGDILNFSPGLIPRHELVQAITALPSYSGFLVSTQFLNIANVLLKHCISLLLSYRILRIEIDMPMEFIKALPVDAILMIGTQIPPVIVNVYASALSADRILMIDPMMQLPVAINCISLLEENTRLMIHYNTPLQIAVKYIEALPAHSFLMIHPNTTTEVAVLYVQSLFTNRELNVPGFHLDLHPDSGMTRQKAIDCVKRLHVRGRLQLSSNQAMTDLQFFRKFFRGLIITLV